MGSRSNVRYLNVAYSGGSVGTKPSTYGGGGIRGEVKSWSKGSSRRNNWFLMSVDYRKVPGSLYSFSLTLRDCPDVESWKLVRKNFFDRLRRMGVLACHWVVEWQKRGVPHLHGVVVLPYRMNFQVKLIDIWLDVCSSYRPLYQSQDCKIVYDEDGWFKYLSKHFSRSCGHDQRGKKLPPGWETSGRMWGRWGEWLLVTYRISLSESLFYRVRRDLRKLCGQWSQKQNAVIGMTTWFYPEKVLDLIRWYSFEFDDYWYEIDESDSFVSRPISVE